MKKNIIALFCVIVLLALLAGCGDGEDASSTDISDTDVSSADTPEADPSAQPADAEASGEPIMTISESVNKLRSFSPAQLGLEGTSMADYNIYPATESVKVDNTTCAKLSVYHNSEYAATNEIDGIYLLARDGSRLFRLDAVTGTVEEIDIA